MVIGFDFNTFFEEAKTAFILNMIEKMCSDEQAGKDATKFLKVFVKHGIPIDTTLDIIMDLFKLQDKENNNESK